MLLFIAPFSYALDLKGFIRDFAESEARRNEAQRIGNRDNRRWDSATLQRENNTGDYSIKNCQYQTLGGFEFSTNVRKYTCPYRVYINIESMQVQIP